MTRTAILLSLALATVGAGTLTAPMARADEKPAKDGAADAAPKKAPTAEEKAEKDAWVAATVAKVNEGRIDDRKAALGELLAKDVDGDALGPLAEALPGIEPELVQIEVARALGRVGQKNVAEKLAKALGVKSDAVRANVAVSLEYIGDAAAVKPLIKSLGKEKVPRLRNHMARAIGRCGVTDDAARKALTKEATGGKNEEDGLGAIIGLAYMEGNEKVARDLEKLIKKVGVPNFGGRGDRGRNTLRRTILGWALGEVADKKSAKFVNDSLLDPLENAQGPFVEPVREFYFNVMRACDGDQESRRALNGSVIFVKNLQPDIRLSDDARRGRDGGDFKPKGEWPEEAE